MHQGTTYERTFEGVARKLERLLVDKDEDPIPRAGKEAYRRLFTERAFPDCDVQTEFVDLRTAQDAEARITKHVATASIRVNGPNRIRIHCVRDGERFGVTHVSAREYGQVAEVVPGKAAATQVDVYAGAILDVYGL